MNGKSAVILGVAVATASTGAQTFKFTPVPSGMMPKVGGYMPQKIELSTTAPASLKKAPAGLAAPMYGTIEAGGSKFLIVVDEEGGKPGKLYVDTNGNGDLTDDPASKWEATKDKAGNWTNMGQGSIQLRLNLGGKPTDVSFGAYRFYNVTEQRAALKNSFLFYPDFGYEGEIEIGGKKMRALLVNMGGGAYVIPTDPKTPSPVRLLIDRDGNGKFASRAEQFTLGQAFNIGGTTYEIGDIAADGSSFKLVTSTKTVAEIPVPPDVSVGKKVLTFNAKDTAGNAISFPSSYKGKVVMLDFWATWCGPCIAELPNVKKAYERFHDQGFEILGISLDQANDGEKLAKFTKDNNMPWAQIFEGKYWDVSHVKAFGVEGIPFVLLVDGDTGEILADGRTLRGEQIVQTIEKALAKKRGNGG